MAGLPSSLRRDKPRPTPPGMRVGVRPRTARPLRLLTETHFLRRVRSLRSLRILRSLRNAALTVEVIAGVYSGPLIGSHISHLSPP